MIDLFFEGGVLFMGILTMVLASSVGLSIYHFMKKTQNNESLGMIKSIGLFALIFGMLGQFVGLFGALDAIAHLEGGVSQTMMADGIRISSITTLYGMVIFVTSYLLWFVLKVLNSKEETIAG